MKPYDRFDSVLEYWAEHYHLPVELVKRQMMAESSGNPRAISRAGARGLMQLMPGTAWELGVKDPFNPDDCVRGGVEYLKRQLIAVEQLLGTRSMSPDDKLRAALASYTGGYGYVRRAIRAQMDSDPGPVTWPCVLARLSSVKIGRKRPKVDEIRTYVHRILPWNGST